MYIKDYPSVYLVITDICKHVRIISISIGYNKKYDKKKSKLQLLVFVKNT